MADKHQKKPPHTKDLLAHNRLFTNKKRIIVILKRIQPTECCMVQLFKSWNNQLGLPVLV